MCRLKEYSEDAQRTLEAYSENTNMQSILRAHSEYTKETLREH